MVGSRTGYDRSWTSTSPGESRVEERGLRQRHAGRLRACGLRAARDRPHAAVRHVRRTHQARRKARSPAPNRAISRPAECLRDRAGDPKRFVRSYPPHPACSARRGGRRRALAADGALRAFPPPCARRASRHALADAGPHVSETGDPPDPPEDLLVAGLLVGLLERRGCTEVALRLLQHDGDEIDPAAPFEGDAPQTARWRLVWRAEPPVPFLAIRTAWF